MMAHEEADVVAVFNPEDVINFMANDAEKLVCRAYRVRDRRTSKIAA